MNTIDAVFTVDEGATVGRRSIPTIAEKLVLVVALACGALVVSRHGCAPAMPSWIELQHFLEHGSPATRLREDTELEHLHRVTTRTRTWDELVVLAFDHRVQFEELAARYGRDISQIRAFKRLIAEGARRGAGDRIGAGIILDGRFGEDVQWRCRARGRSNSKRAIHSRSK